MQCGKTGVERTPNKSQYTKLTLEKKILPPLPPGFELATFPSRVWRSNQQANDIIYMIITAWLFFFQSLEERQQQRQQNHALRQYSSEEQPGLEPNRPISHLAFASNRSICRFHLFVLNHSTPCSLELLPGFSCGLKSPILIFQSLAVFKWHSVSPWGYFQSSKMSISFRSKPNPRVLYCL